MSETRRLRKLSAKTKVVQLNLKGGSTVYVRMRGDRLERLKQYGHDFRWNENERQQVLVQLDGRSETPFDRVCAFLWRVKSFGDSEHILSYGVDLAGTFREWWAELRRRRRLAPLVRRTRIEKPAGTWLLRVSEVLPPKTRERIAIPIIRDMRDEQYEALSRGRPMLAKAVVIRGTLTFLWTIAGRALFRSAVRLALGKD